MAFEIRVADQITDEERGRLFGWGEDIFGLHRLKIEWRPKDWHLFAEVDGQPVSHVGVLRHTVSAGGEAVEVGGIGGVVTVPEAQGRGYAQGALRRAAEFMRDELGVEFGFLFCRDPLVPFYERLGWRLLAEPVEVEQSAGPLVFPLNSMILPCGERAWPAGTTRLNSLPW